MIIPPRLAETSIAANGGVAAIWCEDLDAVGLSMSTAALSGHTVVFEVSNNADFDVNTNRPVPGTGNWYGAQAQRTNATTIETGATALAATPAYGWMVPVSGWRFFRVRVTAHTSGSALWVLLAERGANSMSPNTGTTTVSGTVTVNALPAGTNLIGDVGHQVRATAGGLSTVGRLISAAATTNATSVKASAGRLYKVRGYNAAATVRYLKIYNKASAPTVGTDTPVLTITLKPLDVFDVDFVNIGQFFATGIAYALTTGSADADTGALTLADITGLNLWFA
jgi:hypothetical protein